MPGWAIILSNTITFIIIIGGALNFPYIPMMFGVYEAERYSLRGKLIVKLIWLFPPVSIFFIYMSWAHNGLFALAPFVYIALVWVIRANKGASSGPAKQYKTRQDNLSARLDDIEYRWASWHEMDATHMYILFSFFSTTEDTTKSLKDSFNNTENLHGEIEESSYDNGSSTIYVRIKFNNIEKDSITGITRDMIDIAWNNNCELLSLDIMETE